MENEKIYNYIKPYNTTQLLQYSNDVNGKIELLDLQKKIQMENYYLEHSPP